MRTLVTMVALALSGVAFAEGDLVVTAKWETQGTDIDLVLFGPDMNAVKPADDITQGPGKEVCTVKNAPQGVYLVGLMYAGPQDGPKTTVGLEVRVGDKVETSRAELDKPTGGVFFRTVCVGDAKPDITKVGAGNLTVTVKWQTKGADIDVVVLTPNAPPVTPADDVTDGPGQEVCTVAAPKAGLYAVMAVAASMPEGQKVPVTVEIKSGDAVAGTVQAEVDRPGQPRLLRIVEVAEGAR